MHFFVFGVWITALVVGWAYALSVGNIPATVLSTALLTVSAFFGGLIVGEAD